MPADPQLLDPALIEAAAEPVLDTHVAIAAGALLLALLAALLQLCVNLVPPDDKRQ